MSGRDRRALGPEKSLPVEFASVQVVPVQENLVRTLAEVSRNLNVMPVASEVGIRPKRHLNGRSVVQFLRGVSLPPIVHHPTLIVRACMETVC